MMNEAELLSIILETKEGSTLTIEAIEDRLKQKNLFSQLLNLRKKYPFLIIKKRNTISCDEHEKTAQYVETASGNIFYRCPAGHAISLSPNRCRFIEIDNSALLTYFLQQNNLVEIECDKGTKDKFGNSLPGCRLVSSDRLTFLVFVKRGKPTANDVHVMHSLIISDVGYIAGIIGLVKMDPDQHRLEQFLERYTFGTAKFFDLFKTLTSKSKFNKYLQKLDYFHRTFSTATKIIQTLGFESQKAEDFLAFTQNPKTVLAELNRAGKEGSDKRYEEIADHILGTITKTSRKKFGQKASGIPLPDVLAYFEAPTRTNEHHMNILALDTKSGLDSNFQRKLESTAAPKLLDYILTITKAAEADKRNVTIFGGFLLPMASLSHLRNRVEGIGKARKQSEMENKVLIFTNVGMGYLFSIGHFRSELHQFDSDLRKLKKQLFQPLTLRELNQLPNECKEFHDEDWEDFKELYQISEENGVYIVTSTLFLYYLNELKRDRKNDVFDRMESLMVEIAKENAPKEKLSKKKI